ncbi:Predicted oxidoreductase [Mesorhizobium albiziae]|uniref:Predicted oxidoreductase n=1 Tax=Neomesorhizobium albiziae TaxID=335020 RepID=A0A1I3VD30_9HYPH|nr:aldo/keto reductase [Mesorhizobium albiziae]GLS28819.1 aryl-alcohol dehydrogenase [Mesorhizobium albiziae]SFJ93060.1 Predicted oxidoreductase [Mesorhizobium albiziae]
MAYDRRIALAKDGPSLSRLVLGIWRLLDGDDKPDADSVARLIAAALDLGMTSFDHADIYGNYEVEAAFGAGFRRWAGRRESVELITKCDIMLKSANRPANRVKHYDTSAAHIAASVDRSLLNLNIDYIDILLLHRPDPLMDAGETAEALARLVKSGKIRAVGVSNFTPSQIDLLASRLPFPIVTNQIEMSVLHTDPLADGSLDHSQRLGYAPMIWSPLGGGGLFTGSGSREQAVRTALSTVGDEIGEKDISAIALAWLLRHPARLVPVLGSLKPDRMAGMVRALDIVLDRQQWFAILEASEGREVA